MLIFLRWHYPIPVVVQTLAEDMGRNSFKQKRKVIRVALPTRRSSNKRYVLCLASSSPSAPFALSKDEVKKQLESDTKAMEDAHTEARSPCFGFKIEVFIHDNDMIRLYPKFSLKGRTWPELSEAILVFGKDWDSLDGPLGRLRSVLQTFWKMLQKRFSDYGQPASSLGAFGPLMSFLPIFEFDGEFDFQFDWFFVDGYDNLRAIAEHEHVKDFVRDYVRPSMKGCFVWLVWEASKLCIARMGKRQS